MEKAITKKYSNGEVTIVWKPDACIHSTLCWKEATGLPQVFNPKIRPWINAGGADTARIVNQVKKCPSGALSYFYNEQEDRGPVEVATDTTVEVSANGPLLVFGNITIKDATGAETKRHKVTAFCRCGQSHNKPYCDGSHVKNGFKG